MRAFGASPLFIKPRPGGTQSQVHVKNTNAKHGEKGNQYRVFSNAMGCTHPHTHCASLFPSQSLRIFGAHAAKLRLGHCLSAVDYGRIHDTASSTRRGHHDNINNSITNSINIVFISEPSSWENRAQTTRQWNNELRTTWSIGSYSSRLSGGGFSVAKPKFHLLAGFTQSTGRSMSSSSSSNNVVERIEHFRNGKPTLAYAKTLPRTFAMMTNEQVLHFSEQGSEYLEQQSNYKCHPCSNSHP